MTNPNKHAFLHNGIMVEYVRTIDSHIEAMKALDDGFIVSYSDGMSIWDGYYIKEDGFTCRYEYGKFDAKLASPNLSDKRHIYKITSSNGKSIVLHDGRVADFSGEVGDHRSAMESLDSGGIVSYTDNLYGYYIKENGKINRYENGKFDKTPTNLNFTGLRKVFRVRDTKLKQETNKGVKTMKESIMQYVKEHKTIILTVVLVILVDKLVFKGAFTERLKNIVDKFLGTAEAQLEKKA